MLLTHALRATRRFASGWTVRVPSVPMALDDGLRVDSSNVDSSNVETVEMEILAPGAETLLSPTLAAFLSPRYPFRARTRRNALAAVARAGGVAQKAVSGKTDVLVAGDGAGRRKAEAAAERGARVIDARTFLETLFPDAFPRRE